MCIVYVHICVYRMAERRKWWGDAVENFFLYTPHDAFNAIRKLMNEHHHECIVCVTTVSTAVAEFLF